MRQIESEILSHLGSSDLSYANGLLEGLIKDGAVEDGDFIDWLTNKIDEKEFDGSRLLQGLEDVVALVYEFAIDKIGYETSIAEYVRDRGLENLYSNYLATTIDYDLSEDKEFAYLVKKYAEGKNLEERLVEHFSKSNLALAKWVLSEMSINI